ncbi:MULTISPECIES: MutS-related protein [Rhodanobacter]|uniref:MutS-related protein n=1 Tax=Rhodanobacter TaxID=75309 RepID=UPI0004842CC0|nr:MULTISPECIES: hypothetical protein [Rhodanobacter]KZC18723.1 hypothetical protein RHOFW104R3_34865 [Rhodanobacter denitrificans]UJM93045.1 hypothetical protein LRK32_13885 [Rhodanobacter denitrificans]UJM96575.1 hypothetical protein LRK44_13890 [Rhodanobacter denitrificans]UJN20595.1 hypothetical protein LRK54_12750 [Rhodanobacter denitrificans]
MTIRLLTQSWRKKLLNAASPTHRALTELRAQWSKPRAKGSWLASQYFNLVRDEFAEACVDDKTWADLEFPKIFSSLDSTVTPLGSQSLFRWLREYIKDPNELTKRHAVYEEFQSDASLRETIQLQMVRLKDESNAHLADLIFGTAPKELSHKNMLWRWSLASIALLAAVIAFSWPVWIWLAVLPINGVIILRTYWHAHRDSEALKGCLQMLNVADQLGSLHKRYPSLPQLAKLADDKAARAEVRRSLIWLSVLNLPLIPYFSMWLNLAFLLELMVYVRTRDQFFRLRSQIAPTFELIGQLDAAIAIACYLKHGPVHCQPSLVDRPLLDIRDGRHPLLANGVSNSICLDQRSALITGSNMAGKTTFIKMLGINVIFGRTMGFCLASEAAIPGSNVMALVHGNHSVESGKSHYFSEIETIHSFIEKGNRGDCNIFVIDELFNGTNTIERVAAARAVLELLGRHSLVLVTTHDVELQAFLRDHFDLYHFQEDPDVDGFFDYRLRTGAATERNAIRLLGRMGFPVEVVANATTYAMQDLRSGRNPIESLHQ